MNARLMGWAMGAAALLSAVSCGGGGGGSGIGGGGGSGNSGGGGGIIPPTTSSPTPGPHPVAFGWNGAMAPSGGVAVSASPIPILAVTCERAIEACPSSGVSMLLTEVFPTLTVQETGAATQQQPASLTSAGPSSLAWPQSWTLGSGGDYSTQVGATGITAPGAYALTVTFPDGSNGQIQLYVYHRATIGCGGAANGTQFSGGYGFDRQATLTTTSGADLYLTGPTCPAPFNASNSALNFPNGAVQIPETSSQNFANLTPVQWSNSFTTLSQTQIQSLISSGSPVAILTKTGVGHVVKIQVTNGAIGNGSTFGNDTYVSGAYWVASGQSFSQ